MNLRLTRLKELVEKRAVLHGEFTLASGLKSNYYFDCRRVTHDAEGITLIGELVQNILEHAGVEAVGGPASSANSIITATQIAAQRKRQRLEGFFVRSQQKGHGTQRLIEGNLPTTKGAAVAIVDDTLTTGGSILGAIEAVEAQGCRVVKVVVLVDRGQGGADKLRQKGYDVESLLAAEGDRIT